MFDDLVKRLKYAADIASLTHPTWTVLMTEAADAIEELVGFVQEAERDRDEYRERLDKANNAIEELQKENKEILFRASQLESMYDSFTHWIPVTERLPEIDEKHHCSKDVLAYLKGGGMCFTALEENIFGQTWFECERHPALEEEMIVTHWMPLPSPPKEKS